MTHLPVFSLFVSNFAINTGKSTPKLRIIPKTITCERVAQMQTTKDHFESCWCLALTQQLYMLNITLCTCVKKKNLNLIKPPPNKPDSYQISWNKCPCSSKCPPQESTHLLGHNVKQSLSGFFTFLNNRRTIKSCSCCHFIYNFSSFNYSRIIPESSLFPVPAISISMCFHSSFICAFICSFYFCPTAVLFQRVPPKLSALLLTSALPLSRNFI